MAEPWKDYAAPSQSGPWNQFAAKPVATAPPPPVAKRPEPSGAIRRLVGDTAVDVGRGVIGVGEAAVGVADLATGGRAGKALESVGYKPQEAKNLIGDFYSPERKEANQKVADAKGFIGTTRAMIENPSTILGAVAESAPLMAGGGAVARGLGAVGRFAARPVARAAIGEGVVGAGAAAEQTRQQTDDGLLTGEQVGAAVGSGVGTALIGAAGGSVARKLGIGDVDVALAGGSTASAANKGILRRAAEGALAEGVLEEMPQSMQEQAWQNVATGQPLGAGVAEAGAQGLLTGAAMGGPFAAFDRPRPSEDKPRGNEIPINNEGLDLQPRKAARPKPIFANVQGGVQSTEAAGPITQAAADEPLMVQTPVAKPFPTAAPGSLADAGNALPRSAARPQPALNAGMFERIAAERAADQEKRAAAAQAGAIDPATGELQTPPDGFAQLGRVAAQLGLDADAVVTAARADADPGSLDGLDDAILGSYAQDLAKRTQPAPDATKPAAAETKQALAETAPVADETEPASDAPKSPARAMADQFMAATGDTPEVAATRRAGIALRNGMREVGNLDGEHEADPYTPEQSALLDQYERMKNPSSRYLFHTTTPDRLASITANGLQPGSKQRHEGVSSSGKVSLASNEEVAAYYGAKGDVMLRLRKDYNPGDLEVDALGGGEGAYTTGKAIPPDALEIKQGKKWIPLMELRGAKKLASSSDRSAALQSAPVSPPAAEAADAGVPAQAAPAAAAPQSEQGLLQQPGAAASVPLVQDTPNTQGAAAEPEFGSEAYWQAKVDAANASKVATAAAAAATSPTNELPEPTEAQREAGNFTVGRMRVNGMDISIEHPAGVKRKAEHSQELAHAYGYIRLTEGADGEKVDVFLGDRADDTSLPVFVVDQNKVDGSFDEHKAMMGFASEAEARAAYQANYPKDWKGLAGVRQFSQDEFKAWVRDAEATKKPATSIAAPASRENLPAHQQFDAKKEASKRALIDAQQASNREALGELKLKKGDQVTFKDGEKTVTGTFHDVLDAHMGFVRVHVEGARGTSLHTVPAAKIDPPLSAETVQYRELASREEGNADYYNADLAKLLAPEYAASKEGRRDNNEKVAAQASKTAFNAFADRLKARPVEADATVTLMAGGTSSGKTTLRPDHGIVYDSTMYDAASAKRNIELVLDSGRGVEYRYVFTDPEAAFRSSLVRGKETGRFVNETAFVRTHAGAHAAVQTLMKEYAGDPDVQFILYDNTNNAAREVDSVPAYDYNGLKEKIHEILDQEFQAGRIDEAEYRAVSRTEPPARGDARVAGEGSAANPVRGPEQSEGLVNPESPPTGGVSASAAPAEEAHNPQQEAPDAPVEPNRDPAEQKRVSGERGRQRGGNATARGADRQPVDDGLAGAGEGAAGQGSLFAGAEGAGGAGAASSERSAERDAPGTARADAGVRPESGAAGAVEDFDLTGEDLGKGGQVTKYRENVAAIRIIKALEADGRVATPEERKQLARYVGWGALKGVFDPQNKQWSKQHAELKELLTPDEFAAARASTRNAHFTSQEVVAPMIAGLQRLGFTKGRLLEPSVGTGNFFGMMPARLRGVAELFGVELDPLTSKIAAGLYPSARITNSGFEDYQVPGGFFDAAIGNPPFGEEPIADHDRSPYSGFTIHNYFLAKTIDKLRPGGVAMMVVSHHFLDARDARVRQWIADRASLIAAVRLPDTAFKGTAGTDVVTDVLVFQKHDHNGLPSDDRAWVNAGKQTLENPKTGESVAHNVSQYFLDHPENVLGEATAAGSMYGPNQYTVKANGELAKQLNGWVERLPQGIYQPIDRTESMHAAEVPDGIKVGSYYVDSKGLIQQRGEDTAGAKTATSWTAPNAKAEARMRGMIAVRDALREQMKLERDPMANDKAIDASRKRLNKAYDGFLADNGYLNAPVNRRLFIDDSDSDLVQALEFDYDNGISKAVAEKEGIEPRGASARKADIFERRVAFPQNDMQTVMSAKDALIASLNYRGMVDVGYMARIYDKAPDAIVSELGDLVFSTPEGTVETADAYLSGDVKTKLAEAEAAAKDDQAYARNVKALKAVIPADKSPSEIHVSLGAHFVPGPIVADFMEHITGAKVSASYVKSLGRWMFNKTGHVDEVRNAQTWGTPHVGADAIIRQTIDGRTVVVTKQEKIGDSTRTIVLEAETEAAREKQNAIRNEWKSWLWRDPERGEQVLAEYNDKMNRTVQRRYDGSHLTLPGKNPAITLLKHQLDGIWRGLQSRQILLDHVVGAGKTFQVVGMVMEMRRLGIARKPVLAVPNHLTLQWRSEFTRLYPGARVLAATPEDFSKENRPKLFSKIVTGDWDAVILGHSSLKKIGLPPETEAEILKEQIVDLASAIEEIKRERGDRNIVRDMEGIKKNLEAKMKERLNAAGPRDKVLTFDELGLDALGVDELHEFKNLTYSSTMTKVPGMGNPKGSARAFDLFVKTQWLFNTYGDQAPLITATGTPVSNSLVEMYNVQRYMQYPRMKRDGLHMFDAWARAYGSVENVYEVAPSGSGFRASSRFAKFQNLSSLMADYMDFADVITLDDLKAQEEARGGRFPAPKVKGGRPQLIVAPRSPLVANFMGVPKLARWPDDAAKFKLDLAHGDTFETEEKDGRVLLTMKKAAAGAQPVHLGNFENAEEARAAVVEAALTPEIELDENSVLGRFARLRDLTRETKGKVNALSLTGEANKAGLDYRLIDPAAPDFPDSKINQAVGHIVAEHKAWKKDKGTQLVFCDMSVPLSARAALADKPKRAYVRDADGSILHKRATLHSLAGSEELPFLIVEARAKSKDRPAAFAVYDAATGHLMAGDQPNRAAAKTWAESALASADAREQWIKTREASGELQQEEIDEYNDANEIDTAEVEAITLQDIAGASGAAGFSVYDDMRAKLVKKGIPEREIAFIHDYSTPSAKAKLFAAVNRGDVRVLFGSTPKMGAGTNVQERAVALHHIDAPWKPSDLEQREGRVIRRGNRLYERDPEGFEVGIYRYATAQTYDARRWQILEHKARGIEQLRNFDGSINEIDDIDGEASNAADMKAAASGDPLILRETQLRNDVKRLENLESAHADNVVAARRASQRAKEDAEKLLPRKLAAVEKMLAARLSDNKEGVPAGSAVGGKKYGDRKEFTQALARAVGAVVRDANLGRQPDELTIKWRGLEFEVTPSIFGSVHVTYDLGDILSFDIKEADGFSASGLVTRMNNAVDRLDAQRASLQEQIEEARSNAARFLEEAGKPFADAENLASARRDFKSVQRVLLLKGPDLQTADKKALETGLETQRVEIRKAGLGDALDEMLAAKGDVEGKFSRAAAPGRRLTMARAQQLKQELTAQWGEDAPRVVLVESAEELQQAAGLPRSVLNDPDFYKSEGYYKGKSTVWLNLASLGDEARFGQVLAHEALGHYGVERVVGRGEWKSISDAIARHVREGTGAPDLRAAIKQVQETQPEEVLADPLEMASEVIAVMAENGSRNGLLARVIASVKRFLRRTMPKLVNGWSDNDIRDLLSQADSFLHRGRSRQQHQAFVRAHAFSRARTPVDTVNEIQRAIHAINGEVDGGESPLERAKQWLKDATPKQIKDRMRGSWLGLLTTRHLTQLGADYDPTMTIYSEFLAKMGADRNALQQEGEQVAEAVREWAGKNRAEAARLFAIMHDATIQGSDPAEDYKPLQFIYARKTYEVNRENVRQAIEAIKEQMRGRPGDDKRSMMAEISGLRAMLKAEPQRRARYPAMVARFNALTPEAQAHYRAMRDLYAARHDATEAALVARINDLKLEGGEKRKAVLVNMIRHQFEQQRLQGVYFPLQRFGRYFVAADKDDASTFLMFESQPALERAVKGLKERGFTITAQGLKSASKAKDAPAGTFVAEVLDMLQKSGVSEETRDQVYQMYLQALPDLSMRKHKIHRKVVPGWDSDALRAFAFNMHHGAHQLARLRYAHKLSDTIEVLQAKQDRARREEDADTARIVAFDGILDELRKRHEWIGNPQDSKATNLVSSFGFTYYLGLTPAAALVNLTQVPLLAYPYLASRFGGIKAMNELLRGLGRTGRTLGHIQRTLTDPEELRAHKALQDAGALDKTQVHNLAGIAEGGLSGYNPKYAKAMEIVSKPFHVAEVMNREATGLAAFRLARAAGKDFNEAVRIAAEAINETMFDYTNANRARFMQSGTAKVLLMFRQYSLNMTWHMARMLWNATKAADPDVKRIARRNLAGVLGMSALFSGTLGLPLMSMTMGLLNAVAASGGDDDEPWEAETEFRAFLVDLLGEDLASIVLDGPVNRLTGADVASRVSLSQLWFRDADRELDGRGAYYNLLEQAAGPMGGVLKNALVGKQLIDDGHVQRGVETMLPKALKDAVKAARYASEGANNLRGDPLVADLNLGQVLLQLVGFTPAEVAERYDRNRSLKNYEQHVLDRRQRLMDAFALSVRLEDAGARAETLEAIRAFNKKWPELGITAKTLRRSLLTRAHYSERAENGIMLNKKIAGRIHEAVGGE